jgi:hypothetical protein
VPLPTEPLAAPVPPPVAIVYVERIRRRRWPWVLGGLLMVTLLCCGAGGAWFAPIGAQWPAHIAVGARAGGYIKDTGIATSIVADQVTLHMDAQLPIEGAAAARLTDPAHAGRYILFLGATRLITDPAGELNAAIASSRTSMGLTEVTPYDPGRLGGEVRCAHGRDNRDTAIVVCAWIDHGSEAVAAFYGSWSLDESATAFEAIRADVLTRH